MIIFIAGCTTAEIKVHDQETALAETFQTQITEADQHLPTRLGWNAAVAQMLEHNFELQQARDAVITSEERLRQVNKDLIPGAAITGSVTKALTQLGDLNGDDAAFSIYGFFNVPGLIQWRMRYYAGDLELLRARWALELKTRELTIQLRELFLRTELLSQRRRQLALADHWDHATPLSLSLDASPPSLERETTLWNLRREEEDLLATTAKLLGDSSQQWHLIGTGAPSFNYAENPPDLRDTEHFAQLYRRLLATDLEGARLRQRGIKLQYWPDLQINLSSPPLYQVNQGRTRRWSGDDLVLNLSATVPLDLRGSISQQLRETKRDFARLEIKIREQTAQTIQTLRQAQTSLTLNARQLQLTEARLDALRGLPSGMNPARARENLERLLSLDQQRTSLLLEKVQLEALFWLLDETKWSPPAIASNHINAPAPTR